MSNLNRIHCPVKTESCPPCPKQGGSGLISAAKYSQNLVVDRETGLLLPDLNPDLPADLAREMAAAPIVPPKAEAGPTAAELLAEAGVEVIHVTDPDAARGVVLRLCLDAVQFETMIGVDIETEALPEFHVMTRTIRITKTGKVAARQPILGDEAAPLDPHRSRPRLFQAYAGGDFVAVFDLRRIPFDVFRELAGHDWVAANAKFEAAHLVNAGFPLPENWADCLSMLWQIFGNRWANGAKSLERAADLAFGITLPKKLGASDWAADDLSREQIEYAALDAVLAQQLRANLLPGLDAGQQQAQEMADSAIEAVARAELAGIGFDVETHRARIADWNIRKAEIEKRVLAATGGRPLGTAAEITRWLTEHLDPERLEEWPSTKTGRIATDRAALLRAVDISGIKEKLELTRVDKMLSSFGETLIDKLNPVTGRLHTSFRLPGAKTGRLASSDPNLQQAPKRTEKAFRDAFIAKPGHVLLRLDYSQMELRTAAEVSGDEAMRGVYARGEDLHRKTAQALSGLEDPSDADRSLAKACNFGLLFGSGARTFAQQAFVGYGLDLDLDEAGVYRDAFFDTYPGFRDWQLEQARVSRQDGYAKTLGGRKWFWHWEHHEDNPEPDGFRFTLSLNVPIQGTCAEIVQIALGWVEPAVGEYGAQLLLQVHDELVIECPEDPETVRAVARIAKVKMAKAMLLMLPGSTRHGLVDCEVGRTWGSGVPLEKWLCATLSNGRSAE